MNYVTHLNLFRVLTAMMFMTVLESIFKDTSKESLNLCFELQIQRHDSLKE